MNDNDKIFLDMLDDFNEDELKSLISDINVDESSPISNESLNRIKEKTFNRITKTDSSFVNTTEKKPKKSFTFSKKKAAIAAAICFLILTPFSDKVIADIKKAFRYIPGANQIIENEQNTDMYILQNGIKVSTKNGYAELLSVVIDNDKKVIYLSARGEEKEVSNASNMTIENFAPSVKLGNGKIIKLNNGSMGSGGGDGSMHWQSDFSSDNKDNKNIFYNDGEKIEIQLKVPNNDQINIPITLKKAINYNDYRELGPTCEKNGLSITAVPKWTDNKLKINLLTPKSNNFHVAEYGKNPNYKDEEYHYKGILDKTITLTDNVGKSYKISASGSYAPPLSEFYFHADKNQNISYKLNIPYVMIEYNVDVKHKLTLPKVGEKINLNNEIIALKDDYKLKLLSINRTKKDEVVIEVDTGYDESKIESMFNLQLETDNTALFRKPDYNSWGAEYYEGNDKKSIGSLTKWIINLNHPDSSNLNLYISKFYTIKKGPWIIPIDNAKIIK